MISQNAKTIVESIIAILSTETELQEIAGVLSDKLKADTNLIAFRNVDVGGFNSSTRHQRQSMVGSHVTQLHRPHMNPNYPYGVSHGSAYGNFNPAAPFQNHVPVYNGNSDIFRAIVENGFSEIFASFKSAITRNIGGLKPLHCTDAGIVLKQYAVDHITKKYGSASAPSPTDELFELFILGLALIGLDRKGILPRTSIPAVVNMISALAAVVDLNWSQFEDLSNQLYDELDHYTNDQAANAMVKSAEIPKRRFRNEIAKLIPHHPFAQSVVWYDDINGVFELSPFAQSILADDQQWRDIDKHGHTQGYLMYFAGVCCLPMLLQHYFRSGVMDLKQRIMDAAVHEINSKSFYPVFFDDALAANLYVKCTQATTNVQSTVSLRAALASACLENTNQTTLVKYDPESDYFHMAEGLPASHDGFLEYPEEVLSLYFAYMENLDVLVQQRSTDVIEEMRALLANKMSSYGVRIGVDMNRLETLYKRYKQMLGKPSVIPRENVDSTLDTSASLFEAISFWVNRTLLRNIHHDYKQAVLHIDGQIKTSWTPHLILLRLLDIRKIAMAEDDVVTRDQYMTLVNELVKNLNV